LVLIVKQNGCVSHTAVLNYSNLTESLKDSILETPFYTADLSKFYSTHAAPNEVRLKVS